MLFLTRCSHSETWTFFIEALFWHLFVVCVLLVSSLVREWIHVPPSVWRLLGNSWFSTRRLASDPRSILRCLVLWFFCEMTSGTCSWILRSCSTVDTRGPVSPRGFYRISHILFVLVDSDTMVLHAPRFHSSRPVQSQLGHSCRPSSVWLSGR